MTTVDTLLQEASTLLLQSFADLEESAQTANLSSEQSSASNSWHTPQITFEKPADRAHGDWATTVALTSFKQYRNSTGSLQNPRQLAEALVLRAESLLKSQGQEESKLATPNLSRWLEKITVAGPGFINLTFSSQFYAGKMLELLKNNAQPTHKDKNVKTAIVEYSSPNIAKPFTIGHLRSTIIGDAVANLLEATGYTVLRDNHLGDWGTQFGKQIYAIKHLGLGTEEANIAQISSSENPVKALVALYVEFHQKAEVDPTLEEAGRAWFAKLEQGDPEARKLWQLCIEWSFVEFEKIYAKLGITFHQGFANGRGLGESFFEDKMGVVLEQLEQKLGPKGLYRESDGAKLIFFPDDELPPLMIIKQDGSTLYATRDLATDYYRKQQFGDDVLVVNEVGAEQALYFKQLYRAEELLGWYKPNQRVHVQHGLYRFKDTKMSTRKGNVIWLEEVLAEATQRASALAEHQSPENTHALSIAALKWNDLKRSAHLSVTFDWDEVLSMQGNSGPYLLYSFVRAKSILDKAERSYAISIDTVLSTLIDDELSTTAEYKIIVRSITEYFDVVDFSAREFAPHHLCTYLYELAQLFNSFYTTTQVLEEKEGTLTDDALFRLAIVASVATVLKNGLALLGIKTVDSM